MEILVMISNEAPHIYLHNGVTYSDMELMASVLFDSLFKMNESELNIFFFV